MTSSATAPLLAATHVQCIAEKCGNEQLAFVLTGLSCVLVAKMVWDQFGLVGGDGLSHRQRLNAERIDRRMSDMGPPRR